MPLVFVLIPLVALLLINLPLGSLNRKLGFPTAALLALLQIAAVIAVPGTWVNPAQFLDGSLKFVFTADRLSLLLLLSIGIAVLERCASPGSCSTPRLPPGLRAWARTAARRRLASTI